MKTESYENVVAAQEQICMRYDADFVGSSLASKLGISKDALIGTLPIHGLRHAPTSDTCGWYIWSGDYSDHADFFMPLHVAHAIADSAVFVPYLGLAPGWRFLIGPDGYEDVWFDESLLEIT